MQFWTAAQRINLSSNPLQCLPPKNIFDKCQGINNANAMPNMIYDIYERLQVLEKDNSKLREENLHLRYAYGGKGFQEAQEDYDSFVKN